MTNEEMTQLAINTGRTFSIGARRPDLLGLLDHALAGGGSLHLSGRAYRSVEGCRNYPLAFADP